MRRLLAVALLFGLATPAFAGRLGSYSLWCGAKGGDLLSTELALQNSAIESNPLMRDRSTRIGVGIGACVAAGEVDHRLRKHTKTKWVYRILGMGLMGYATYHNTKNAAH